MTTPKITYAHLLTEPNQPSIWRLRYRRTDVGKFPNVGSTEIRMAIQAAFSLLRASSAARCAFLAAEIISLMRLSWLASEAPGS